jgi:predicted nucleic acid-binding protein
VYLIDADVLSVRAPTKRQRPEALIDWMDRQSDLLFLSAISVFEITDGIGRLRRRGAVHKSDAIDAWLATVLHLYGGCVLAFDAAVAGLAGLVPDEARAKGAWSGFAGIAIAATARHHGLAVLTRNRRHFANLGVRIIDPIVVRPAS